jgi:NADH:ubiquinone oxidoreductase subunit F (NADH-binding)/ferredoxin
MRSGLPEVRNIGPAWLTAGLDRVRRLDWPSHRALHGEIPLLSLGELVMLAEAGDLRGRGGAGFPFARKVMAVAESANRKRSEVVVVVNGTEGEPGSFKDKVLLTSAPHLMLDGAVLAATALRAREVVVGVTDAEAQVSVESAIAERGLTGLARVVRLPERFVSGEGGALVRGINGLKPIPPGRKVRASDMGVSGVPTLLSNTETYSQLAMLAALGADGYRTAGTTDEPGTVLLTVLGSARAPAVVEAPAGIPLRVVLEMCDADPGDGVVVGGYHGKAISGEAAMRAELSRGGMKAVGGALGAGIILPLGKATCPLGEVARVTRYMAGESAGQCGPCYLGLPVLADAMEALAEGRGGSITLETVKRAAQAVPGRGACAHPDGLSRFVLSALDAFADDVQAHVLNGSCGRRVTGMLPIHTEEADQPGVGRLVVDWSRCDGHGLCALLIPGHVTLDIHGYPVIPNTPLPARLERNAEKAIKMCPALALRLERTGSGH